ncbi:hypothetical protein HRbin04_00595 [archaeon HR04]|jgi:hypothetical protein|nr:hypothetical protein HRbin04_00595 [archaeon HR04]
MNLYGKFLSAPKLRFSSTHVDTNPRRGLRYYGPYDLNFLEMDKVKCIVLSPSLSDGQTLIKGLMEGEGQFKGFEDLFKLPLECIGTTIYNSEKDFNYVLNEIVSKNPDIVYVVLNDRNQNIYSQIKLELLANGIPSQMITIKEIRKTHGRVYTLENLSLATYAKIGGTPWTISTSNKSRLILGISRTKDSQEQYLVGFVVSFTNDGDFLFMRSETPVVEWTEYIERLSKLIEEAIIEYKKGIGNENKRGSIDSIIIHLHKKPGKNEINAIEDGLKCAVQDIPYAIVHLNEYSNFRLFDSSHSSYIPCKGLYVTLSLHESLILLDGRVNNERNKVGMPRILDVRIDKRSTLDVKNFSDIFKQVYDFSFINWRGFNAAAIPVTLNYSKLIAKMVGNLNTVEWNELIIKRKLRDKKWFL